MSCSYSRPSRFIDKAADLRKMTSLELGEKFSKSNTFMPQNDKALNSLNFSGGKAVGILASYGLFCNTFGIKEQVAYNDVLHLFLFREEAKEFRKWVDKNPDIAQPPLKRRKLV